MFNGIPELTANFSKLPHAIIDNLHLMETAAEMKVIFYILRHTLGYQDKAKKITLDEFEHGRMRRNRTRLDNGTGMSRNAIKDGIKRAVKHGFIVVEKDDRDKARTKHFYSLNFGGSNIDPQQSNVDTPLSDKDSRTEKETLAKKPKKEISGKPQKSPKQQKQKPVTPPVPEDDTPELDDFFEPSLSPPLPPHKPLTDMEMLMGGIIQIDSKFKLARQSLARSGKKCYGPYKENMETVIVNFLAITGYQVPTGDGAWGKWTKGAKEISRCYKIDDIPDLMRKAYHKLKEGDMPTSHPLALNNTMQAIWQEKQAGKSSTPNLTPAGLAAYKKMQEAEAGGR